MIDGLAPRQKWLVFGFVLLCHVYFFQTYPNFVNTNELSRLLLVSAIVDYGTLQIDQPLKRFGDNQDKAFFQGHFYSDKPPGTAFLAIPVYWILKQFGPLSAKAILFWLRLFCITVPALLLLNVLTRYWNELGRGEAGVRLLAVPYLFGTIAFTYSMEFISHYLAGILLICSFYYINKKPITAGVLSGAAVLLEYPSVIAVLCLLVYCIIKSRSVSIRFVLGALPFGIAILIYQNAIFGNPFELTYRHMTNVRQATEYAQGALGLGLRFPQPNAIWGLLFSIRRGLFVFCPILLFAFPGFYFLLRDQERRAEGVVLVSIIATAILFYSCLTNWDGRWAFGPRYLAGIVPFVMTGAIAFFAKRPQFRFLILPLALLSILIVTIGTLTFPFPPEDIHNPFFILHLPLALRSAFADNMGASLPSVTPLIVFYGLLLITAATTMGLRSFAALRHILLSVVFAVVVLVGGALLSGPPSTFDYFARGSVLYYLGKYQYAEEDLQRALAGNPDDHLRLMISSRFYQIKLKLNSSSAVPH